MNLGLLFQLCNEGEEQFPLQAPLVKFIWVPVDMGYRVKLLVLDGVRS